MANEEVRAANAAGHRLLLVAVTGHFFSWDLKYVWRRTRCRSISPHMSPNELTIRDAEMCLLHPTRDMLANAQAKDILPRVQLQPTIAQEFARGRL
jgi:hypothetical protein